MVVVSSHTDLLVTLLGFALFGVTWLKNIFQKNAATDMPLSDKKSEETAPIDTNNTRIVEQTRTAKEETQVGHYSGMQAIQIGSTLSERYLIEKELGSGSIGIVYLARDRKLMDRRVVIKCLLESVENSESGAWYQKKFLQEQEALLRIDHPGIVGVLETGLTPDGKPYFVMQYVEGRNLKEVLKTEKLDLKRIANIVKQVGRAVSAAHDKGVLHCDLKPANIMLQSWQDSEEHVKVIDFGVAKIVNSQFSEKNDSTRVAGSPAFMAPEQLNGKPTTASDIFSLAVVAYRLITGRLPFEAPSMFELYELQRQGVAIKPSEFRDDLPVAAEEAILKALSFEARDRYRQAREFGDHLAEALMGANLPREVAPLRIALLYKRNAEPDAEILRLLENGFRAQGYQVFIDRHLTVGMEWAKEIERQIRQSDVVVPLLSAASVTSEMLGYEVQLAHEAAQKNGKPRLLPVRVQFTDALPQNIAGFLEPLQYTLWTGEADNQRLFDDLLNAIEQRTPQPAALPKLETVGGAVPLDSAFYIERPTDREFLSAIRRRDSIVLVKGARQMGKTSLLARGLREARENGVKVVLTDFQKLNAQHLQSAETLFKALGAMIADQLDLDVLPEDVWNERRGASMNFERYLKREVLGKIPQSLVWGMDEVDRLFSCDFASEVFGLFRSWHNERQLDPEGPWQRLTMAIVYATEAHLFITDLNQSPFNVGTRLALYDFTLEEVAELNRRYGSPLKNRDEVERFFDLLSGQPYLVRRGLQELATHYSSLSEFAQVADRDEGPFGDHLRRMLVLLAQDATLGDMVRGLLRGDAALTPDSFYRLRSAGLFAGDSSKNARPRCKLYANYFERHLL